MKPLTFFFLFLVAISALAQTAAVQPLTESEAKHAKELYAARDAANQAIKDWDEQLEKKYLRSASDDDEHHLMHGGCLTIGCKDPNAYWTKTGWENGFQYDKTFRFIVPSPTPASIPASNCYPSSWNCGSSIMYANPALTGGTLTGETNVGGIPVKW